MPDVAPVVQRWDRSRAHDVVGGIAHSEVRVDRDHRARAPRARSRGSLDDSVYGTSSLLTDSGLPASSWVVSVRIGLRLPVARAVHCQRPVPGRWPWTT
jgi:hypothetical protein